MHFLIHFLVLKMFTLGNNYMCFLRNSFRINEIFYGMLYGHTNTDAKSLDVYLCLWENCLSCQVYICIRNVDLCCVWICTKNTKNAVHFIPKDLEYRKRCSHQSFVFENTIANIVATHENTRSERHSAYSYNFKFFVFHLNCILMNHINLKF